jgi:UDP-glucose:(heptosyl)LPS alpha-1,3-glucosyltransferase
MKVALVILDADPARGGAERYTVDLAYALVKRRVEVSVVASAFGPSVSGRPVHLAVRSATRLGRYLKFLDALDDHLCGERYDIVHAMLPVRRCDVYHPHAGLAADSIVTGHEKYDGLRRSLAGLANHVNRKRQRFATVEGRLLEAPDPPIVLCLSEYVKRTVRKHYQLPERKLAALFNAVDLEKFDPALRPAAGQELRWRLGIAEDRIIALIIAQDYLRKGLAEAILGLPQDDARLVLLIVGKQKTRAYKQLAREHGVAERVIFAGPTSDPYSFYRAADFFVLPTRHDPCSLVVLEALAMGVPVISTVFNGACEIMTDGLHGFVLNDPRNVSALRERYRQMLDPALRATMSAACSELRPQLSQDRHVDRLLEIYNRRI